MRIKSRGAVAALALALAAAGGSAAAVRTAARQPAITAPAALPAPAGPAATAAMPSPSLNGAALAGTAAPGNGVQGTAAGPGSPAAGPGSPAAGRGSPGPAAPPAGKLPADGAVPGASPALRALAAARAATTALPHSPRLLGELRAPALPGGRAGTAGLAAVTPAASSSPGSSPSPSPSPAPAVAGIDVASYQHEKTSGYPDGAPISWSRVAAAGYRFATVKATEGDYYISPWEASDLAAAKAAGLYVTAYHFAIPNVSGGAAQARFAVASSGYASGPRMLPLMLDIEYDPYVKSDRTNECYGLSRAAMTAWLAAFAATARQLTGQYPVIYTTADWWGSCTGGSTAFGADPLWVAAYGVASPPMPAGWAAWTYWQYTSGGTVPGVPTPGATDLSHFNVDLPGLISPGSQASRPGTRVSLRVPALAALAGKPLAYSAHGLPAGLWISPGGLITGLAGSAGSGRRPATYHVTVSATAAGGAPGTTTFSWRVASSCGSYLNTGVCPGR